MNLRSKILLLATVPLLAAVAAITHLVESQTTKAAQQTKEIFEKAMVESKKEELLHYIALARTSIDHLYDPKGVAATPDEAQAKGMARSVLDKMTFGPDGYFFVYDYSGISIVHPKQPWRVGQNYLELRDREGRTVIRNLIDAAKTGGDFTRYSWVRPSTGTVGEKIGYAIPLERWNWMLGTGIYIDDVLASTRSSEQEVHEILSQTSRWIVLIALTAVLGVFGIGIIINVRESRLADGKLRILTQRIVAAQEDERSRVARELHDSVSQTLVAVKYTLERAKRVTDSSQHEIVTTIDRASTTLDSAIREVREVSHGLRPGHLDDLGLSRALENLADEFSARTGVKVTLETISFKKLLPNEAKTALYRIAQEALTNVERHADARQVDISLTLNPDGVSLRISDDGSGFRKARSNKVSRGNMGIGLRNMQERVESFGGHFDVESGDDGTTVSARLPRKILREPTGS